jgi:2H phosphodiesterase-like protein
MKFKALLLLSGISFITAFYCQGATLKQSSAVAKQQLLTEHRLAKVVELTDNTGLVYIGAEVNSAKLVVYLEQMRTLLGAKKYQQFRAKQITRDQGRFHITLINPFEYQKLTKKVVLGQTLHFTLHGLGKVAVNDDNDASKNAQSYFVVVSTSDGQHFRQQYALKNKDFHITLGFSPHDIYNQSKGLERLIK